MIAAGKDCGEEGSEEEDEAAKRRRHLLSAERPFGALTSLVQDRVQQALARL